MKQPDILNGQTREQYSQDRVPAGNFKVLESDWKKLFLWVMEITRNIYYYDLQDKKDGDWGEIWKNQVVLILVEMALFDSEEYKREYMTNKGNSKQGRILQKLEDFVVDKIDRLKDYEADLLLKCSAGDVERVVLKEITSDILQRLDVLDVKQSVLLKSSGGDTENDLIFFNIWNAVREVQELYEGYTDRIENSEEIDPALSLLMVFLKNYAGRMNDFNRQFTGLPGFYLKKVLNCGPLISIPDHTWIALEKTPDPGNVVIPAGTRFVAGKDESGGDLFYALRSDFQVTGMQLAEVCSVLLLRDTAKLPAALLADTNVVTSVHRKIIPLLSAEPVPELFDQDEQNSDFVPMGWMMESPMFDLREGERIIELKMQLEPDSAEYLRNFVAILLVATEEGEVTEEKIFGDAFFLKVSCGEGWLAIGAGETVWDSVGGNLTVTFSLDGDMPPMEACTKEVHRIKTENPAIQVNLNRDAAWLFPYVWATRLSMEQLTVKVNVSGLTAVKLYTEYGEQDTSVPFYPFGIQAQKGSWFVIGCHEMARKPLNRVDLGCRWQQLSCMDTGFADHYALYPVKPPVANDSFRVRKEWLKDRKWEKLGGADELFSNSEEGPGIKEEGWIKIVLNKEMPVIDVPEENYVLGKIRSGFVRLVLSEPAMGFGNDLYRQLFAGIMIGNSHKTDPDPLPNEPVVPMMGEVYLDYEAEDTFWLAEMGGQSATCFYQVKPLAYTSFFPFKGGKTFRLAEPVMQRANLLIAFRSALGMDRIRIFLDIVMREDESKLKDENPVVSWYYNDGTHWNLLADDVILQDTTHAFTNVGTIEMLLPLPVQQEWLDGEGKFWIWASVAGAYEACRLVRGFYMNVMEVVAEGGNGQSLPAGTITQSELPLPGIQSVTQLLDGWGGCLPENDRNLSVRIAHRIAHRNRGVVPADFEGLTLQRFPSIEKAKCIPRTESGEAFVRLVVMSREQGGKYPLCSLVTLQEIKEYLSPLMSSFTRLQVVNPVYEKIQVCCQIKLRTTVPTGETLRRMLYKINHYIAPWLDLGLMPELDKKFSLKGLYTILVNDKGITELNSLSVRLPDGREFSLPLDEEGRVDVEKDVFVSESSFGGVFIPAESHEIKTI